MNKARVKKLLTVYEAEVNNGGFDQFFFNTTEDVAPTIEALETIGASRAAALLSTACDRFPGGMPPKDLAKRRELMLTIVSPESTEFDDLDEQFYKYEENLGALLENYLTKDI